MAALRTFIMSNYKNSHNILLTLRIAHYSNFAKLVEYKKCYKILGISEDSDQETIRKAYLQLVKRYHPDSGSKEADADTFLEIDKAFKILINKKSRERWNVEDVKNIQEQDIKHTAPQHRQYLSYDGVGFGTPSQREKQFAKIRAMQAADNVLQHRVSKVSAEEGALLDKNDPYLKHQIKTKQGFDRLVEDLIQESMSKGEFNNLSGSGKPLPAHQNRNPYVDFITHKLNEVLIDNGFTPEWIMLQKEIRNEIQELRSSLSKERSYLGPYPLSSEDIHRWGNILEKHKTLLDQINKKIDKFNLVVPVMERQMVPIDLGKESQKTLINGEHSKKFQKSLEQASDRQTLPETISVFGLLDLLFKK